MSKYKLYSPDEYDKIVSTQIPNKRTHHHLYEMIVKHMPRGSCGPTNPSDTCMTKNVVYGNNYLKDFCEETIHTIDAYPQYRRRDNRVQVIVRVVVLDSRCVVIYNPYLLAKFGCHMNVEIYSTIKIVKYIYKYIGKGHDRTSFCLTASTFDSVVDEIE